MQDSSGQITQNKASKQIDKVDTQIDPQVKTKKSFHFNLLRHWRLIFMIFGEEMMEYDFELCSKLKFSCKLVQYMLGWWMFPQYQLLMSVSRQITKLILTEFIINTTNPPGLQLPSSLMTHSYYWSSISWD